MASDDDTSNRAASICASVTRWIHHHADHRLNYVGEHSWGRVALALVVAAVVAKFVYSLTLGRKIRLPPGPAPLPILGNLTALSGLPHRSLEKLARKYGGLVYLRLGSVPWIVVSSAEVAKEVFKTNDVVFSNRPESCFFRNFTNFRNITGAPYSAHWRHLRKICTSELFTQKRLDDYKESRLEEIRTSIKELFEETGKKGPVDIHAWLHRLLSNNLTRVIMNKRYFSTDEKGLADALEFNKVTARVFAQAGAVVIGDYIPCLNFIADWQGYPERFRETNKIVLDILRKMTNFEERKKLRDEGKVTGQPNDFIDVLLSATTPNGNNPLPDDIVLLVLMDMLVGGTDTSATAIEWALTELLRHPEVMNRVRHELNSVVGPNQLVKEEDLNNLPYLNAVVKETFRLHPATPLGVPRKACQPFQLQGYDLQAGTHMFINQWAIHRDPAIYDRPEEFVPERFLEGAGGANISVFGDSQYQLVPFGSGRRNCAGMPMAMLVIPLILAHLIHSVDWQLSEGQGPEDWDMSEIFGVSAAKLIPLTLAAKPRESAALY